MKKRAVRKPAAKTAPRAKSAYTDFMIQAYHMEADAAERYGEFADQMEVHNNPEVAKLFRKLARVEDLHAKEIMKRMGWSTPPAQATSWLWRGTDAPESAPVTELHYLMKPFHALELALRSEERAAAFFRNMTRSVAPAEVRRVAAQMAKEEREHIRLIKAWMTKVEKPEPGWDRDLDPPNYSE